MPDFKTMPGKRLPVTLLLLLPTTWVGGGALLYFLIPRNNAFPLTIPLWLLGGVVITALCLLLGKRFKEQQGAVLQFRQDIDALENSLAEQTAILTEKNRQLQKDLGQSKDSANADRRALKEVERIFNNTDDAICVIDTEYTIRHANNALADLLNRDREELVNAKCFHIWQTPFCGKDSCPLQRIGRGEKKIVSDGLWIKSASNDTETLSITVTPLTDEEGNPSGIIKTVRKSGAEKTPQKSDLDRWAHDLNNVLAAVIGHTELAIQQTEPETLLSDNLHKSLRSAQRGQNLITQLPFATKAMTPAAPAPRKTERQSIPGGKEKILFVDDEETLVAMTKQFMSELGYQIDGETSGRTALERFRKDPDYYDLVITDQTMPQLTGSEMAEIMLEIRPDLPIILYTGYSESIDRQRAERIGIKAFLMKPVPAAALARTIRSLIDKDLPNASP